jgi:hypothetical protein
VKSFRHSARWSNFCRKPLITHALHQLLHIDLVRIEGDLQQILVPFVLYRRYAFKPYQGLFDLIGSVRSHQMESLSHTLDIKSYGLHSSITQNVASGGVLVRLIAATRNQCCDSTDHHR